jgi:hypothetical protein
MVGLGGEAVYSAAAGDGRVGRRALENQDCSTTDIGGKRSFEQTGLEGLRDG